MSASATPNQVQDIIVRWHWEATDPMDIDLLNPCYPSNHYVAKMLSWGAHIYTSLSARLTAMERLVSESATMDCFANAEFACLIAHYRQLLYQPHAIYTLGEGIKSQFEKMSYNQYALQEQTAQIYACQVDRPLIAIRQERQKWSTQMQNRVNNKIINIAVMHQQTEMVAK
jgi:hypothetical protein